MRRRAEKTHQTNAPSGAGAFRPRGRRRRIGRRDRASAVVLALAAAVTVAGAQSFYLAPDVPTTLGPTTYLPSEIVRNDADAYSLAVALPAGTVVDAAYLTDAGWWLFSVDTPTNLGGTLFQPEDVVLWDGVGYALYFDGSLAGVPPGSDVDAIFLEGGDAGDLVVSFDVFTQIRADFWQPADLVRFDGLFFHPFFDASAATPPISPLTNVTGAAQRGTLLILTFDVPTTLGTATYLPGELVSWDGSTFGSLHLDPAWPASSRANAVAFLAHPGHVYQLLVMKAAQPDRLILSWPGSCTAGADDYGIYRGQLGSWYSHESVDCSDDGGDLTEVVPVAPGQDSYFLVVPRNNDAEGGYGFNGLGVPRPQGLAACAPIAVDLPCP